MNLVDILLSRSTCTNKGVTFIESTTRESFLSYQDLYQASLRALGYLQERGVPKGGEVVIQVENNRDFLVVFWACLLGGIIPVPLSVGKNKDHKEKLLRVLAQLSNPALVIGSESLASLRQFIQTSQLSADAVPVNYNSLFVEELVRHGQDGTVRETSGADVAFVQYSSGSTGSPKGVVLSHANLVANLEGISASAAYAATDSMLSWMPLTHDMGMIGFHLNPLFCGLNQFIMPTTTFVRSPTLWLDKLSEHRVTVTCSPNFGYRYLLKYLKESGCRWDLSAVRIIFNGAEPISADLCAEFTARLSAYGLPAHALCPVYGLAEASVAVSMSALDREVESVSLKRSRLGAGQVVEAADSPEDRVSFVSVGKPVRHCAVSIRGGAGESLGEHTIGRVCIQGDNVTRGYYNNPEASKRLTDGAGWLDTGDLGFLRNGSLYITGRAKDIIFANGQNYYSHDIEREAECVAGIELNKIAVAAAFSEASAADEVIAFVFHRGEAAKLAGTARALQRRISETFGIQLHRVVPVGDIPRTTSGKLQRFLLLERYRNGQFDRAEGELRAALAQLADPVPPPQPLDATQATLHSLWEQVLGEAGSGGGRFFQSGGNSLKAIELAAKIRQAFGVEISIAALYESDTLAGVAAQIAAGARQPCLPIPRAAEAGAYPVSPLQKRMYYAWRVDPAATAYNMPVAVKLAGPVDGDRLERCLAALVHRHDALRTSFADQPEPRFAVHPEVRVVLESVPCRGEDLDATLRALIRPFDLSRPPLFRFFLVGAPGAPERVLLLDFHHSVYDGQSARAFIGELRALYRGEALPACPVSFRDYARWHASQAAGAAHGSAPYWAARLGGEIPVLELPCDFPRAPYSPGRGARLKFDVAEPVLQRLAAMAAAEQVTLHAVFFTLYGILLSKYSGQTDLVIGVPVQAKPHPDLSGVHGMFTNNLPVRRTLRPDRTFLDAVKEGHALLSESLDHRHLPFGELLALLDVPVAPGRAPLFDTMFLYQPAEDEGWGEGELACERHTFDPGFSKFDLSLEVFSEGRHPRYAFEYATHLFAEATIRDFAKGFDVLLQGAAENPAAKIADLTVLPEEAFRALVVEYNRTAAAEPLPSVLSAFRRQVAARPGAVAIACGDTLLTFEALDRRARRVAHALRQSGVGRGDLVAIDMARSPELVAVVLGTLHLGAAYLPLDKELPARRVDFILGDSGCRFLVTDAGQLPAGGAPQSWQVLPSAALCGHPENPAGDLPGDVDSYDAGPGDLRPGDLAYVIYTSGTTGLPKGTLIEHRSLSNYIHWAARAYLPDGTGDFAFYSSISFDLTVTSIFTPLVSGNRMVIYGEGGDQLAIERVLRDNRADVIKLTPSHLRLLADHGLLSDALRVRVLIVGGEALGSDLAARAWRLLGGKAAIYNEYGPTEATVGCMIYRFDPADATKTVPIGVPIANTQIYLLDEDLKPVPRQVPGQIYIAGDGLARGYLFRDGLTREKFVPNPFTSGAQMYRSGDKARRLPDGNLEFLGRFDSQVKVNGHRVELPEIEAALTGLPGVGEAVVLPGEPDGNALCAYYTIRPAAGAPSEAGIREALAARLPYYMVPWRFVRVEAIPLTGNGKVDAAQLRRLQPAAPAPGDAAPANEVERLLARAWARALRVDNVSVHDSFFALGGDSIKAIQIASTLMEQGLAVSVKDILSHQTIRNIGRLAVPRTAGGAHDPGPAGGRFAPTPIQAWFLRQRLRNPHWYTQSVLLTCDGGLDPALLEAAVAALVQHHDALRINLDERTGTCWYNPQWLEERPRVVTRDVPSAEALPAACDAIRQSIDLANTRPVQFARLRVPRDGEYLFITAHHLVVDAVSWRILLEDLGRVYASLRDGRPAALPPKTASFAAWREALHEYAGRPAFAAERNHWRETGHSRFRLPGDAAPGGVPAVDSLRTIHLTLDAADTAFLLRDAHQAYRSDVPILLNAALARALHQWTGAEEVVIEQENHGRHLDGPDTTRTVGWFTCLYPARFTHRQSLGELIKSVKETLRSVPQHGIAYGVDQFLVREPAEAFAPSEIRLNYLGQFDRSPGDGPFSMSDRFTGRESDGRNVISTKIEINALVIGGGFRAGLHYSCHQFEAETMNGFAGLLATSLQEILTHLRHEGEVHLTPSDFRAVALSEDEMDVLFR